MNTATKNILRATIKVYNASKDRLKFLEYMRTKNSELAKEPLVKARNTSTQNHYHAGAIFLRIFKPKTKMEKHEKTVDHGARAHALLSASSASQWINCTPSARLGEQFENSTSSFAEEGTLAHEFAELNLKRDLKQITLNEYEKLTENFKKSSYYSEEMEEYVKKHVDYVIQQFSEAKRKTPDAVLLIETRVDITHLIEEGFGTCDVIIIADGVLEVIDLKYGLGVRVEAEDNSQLKLYGSGALEAYDMMYDIHTVRLTITQPRMDSISSWEISADDLRAWGQEVVKPKALIAYAGEGEQVTGDHCKFCKASPRCKAQADKAIEMARLEFAEPKLLNDEELIEVYKQIPNIDAWFKKVSEYLYNEALAGKKWPEYKLVEGQNRRGWTDEEMALAILEKELFEKDQFSNVKLKGIGDIEKLVGKSMFPTLLGDVVAFKKTSPSLVPDSDKRPAMGLQTALTEFSEDI